MRIYSIIVTIVLFAALGVIAALLFRVSTLRDCFDKECRKLRDAEDRIHSQDLYIDRINSLYQELEERYDSLYLRKANGIISNGDSIRRFSGVDIPDDDLAKIALTVSTCSTCKVNADGALCKDGGCWHGWVKWLQMEKNGG